ncbi:glycosyltransferase family 2 protein [Granulosicoccaceae sp. 1_MG-2023]|nr:glycosyltransferase family 2 protein [Granulosicoccaceae sp. 1_MG-2023]
MIPENEQPLVSVVTPVYNGEAYLAEALDSVLAQSYSHWELLILDNASDDGSYALAQRYAAQDSRIRVFRNEQQLAQMPNWNRSMSLISDESRFCKVVHADDWLFPDCLMQMVSAAMAAPQAGIIGAYRLEEESVSLDGLPFPSHCVDGREMLRKRFLGGPDLFGSPSSIMYRSDEVRARRPFYNEDNLHADTEVCYDILLQRDFAFVHQVLTFTRRHNETTSTFAKRMQTYIPADLMMLKKYGARVLSEDELSGLVERKLQHYYRFLGFRLWKSREAAFRAFSDEFWDYHKAALRRETGAFSRVRVARGLLLAAYRAVINKITL